ncbi:hypothetical protein L7F22_041327 [Adiantum nelumboides]|nr:hypothetical protein [Adiantum nelumboides]
MAGREIDENDLLAPQQDAFVSLSVETAGASLQDAAQNTRKRRKIKSAELEEMHAASQRLLRETPNASFRPQVTAGKSITSVLEKIRLRKKELVKGRRSAFWVPDVQPGGSDSLEFLNDIPSSFRNLAPQSKDLPLAEGIGLLNKEVEKTTRSNGSKNGGEELQAASSPDTQAEQDGEDVDVMRPPKICLGRQSDKMERSPYLGSGNAFRAPMEDTQDLLSCSESSDNDNEEDLNVEKEDDEGFGGSRVNLYMDTETQDDYEEWVDASANKENVEPAFVDNIFNSNTSKGPSVRSLIDDEAEDEDEDILVPGEDDEGDDGEDLDDMVVEETNEKLKDKEKRAELHRKWLEQQDAVMTDDILLRLKTGWRPRENRKRGLEFLDDEVNLFVQKEGDVKESPFEDPGLQEGLESLDEDSQNVEALQDDVDPEDEKTFKHLEDLNDVQEFSDDEEAEQRMMRERFLQESDEQGEFMSPADDETSREIFGLINKVNIASLNKKLKHGSVNELRYRSGGNTNSNSSIASKSSFLRRSVSSTFCSVQRQGSSSGSGTRSFIFGRDDSNSSHSFDQHASLRENKENLEPTAGLIKESRHFGQGKDIAIAPANSSATRLGPSLFEILRRQSTNMDYSLKKNSFEGNHLVSPILTAFKPIKSTNTPRGARRA